MAFTWNSELINALSNEDLRQLLANASAKGNEEVCSLCREEMELRKPKPKRKVELPEGFVPVVRGAISRRLEKEVVELLVETAQKLLQIYDFSAETARAKSVGSTGFKAHSFLEKKGTPKVGGAQLQGRVSFDRYISYRLRDEVYALVAILLDGEDETGVKYQVLGPRRLLTNFLPIREIRPYLIDEESIGVAEGGEEFSTYRAAAERFEWLIEQVAPKR